VLGRETFLSPVRWEDGWPVVDPIGETVTGLDLSAPVTDEPPDVGVHDGFDQSALDPPWISVRRRRDCDWSLEERRGSLVLHGTDADMDEMLPVFVGRRQQHRAARFAATVTIDGFGANGAREAGLCLRMDERHHVEVALVGGEVVARARVGDLQNELGRAVADDGSVVLSIETAPDPDTGGPDELVLGYDDADGRVVLGALDGRHLSTEVTGGFTGRVCGMYAVGGSAAFDWFGYEPDLSDP
jgi:beta-xylosidase